jgi:pyruvate dehydrogenase E1 component alpha subunit
MTETLVSAVDSEQSMLLHRIMIEARQFDLQLGEIFAAGKLPGWFHSCEGHEATGATLALCLRDSDHLVPYHRSRSAQLAKGMTLRELAAELMGRACAESRGRGGDGHIISPKNRIYGMSGVLGASIPFATGIAYASVMRGLDEVTVCGFGDGTSNRGAVFEGLNLAAIWDLPVVFVCENNLYAEFSPISAQMRVEHIADRAGAFGIPGVVVNGNDPDAVLPVLAEAVDRARSGGGPTLVEAKTYRHRGHYNGDPEVYRTRAELSEWKAKDPVLTYRARLVERGAATEAELVELEAEVHREVADALAWALDQPQPEADVLLSGVYAEGKSA